MNVLIVEDSPHLADRLALAFTASGYEVSKATTLKDAREQIKRHWPEFVILDANFPVDEDHVRVEFNAPALLDILADCDGSDPTVILMSGDDRTALYFSQIRAWLNTGRIADVLPKNVEGGWDFLKELLVHRVEILRPQRFLAEVNDTSGNQHWLYRNGIVSQEEAMLKVAGRIRRIVNRTENADSILITGPSGSGKGLIARAVHDEMVNKTGGKLPFIAVHCGSFTDTTATSELLGYVKGAFTGADADKRGCLEAAGDGVLFLDDIHLLTPEVHRILLQALQDRSFRRVGSNTVTQFEGRVVSTTNVDLDELARRGQMPDEFYNRIARDTVILPPLVQRPRDIEPLMRHFLAKRQKIAPGVPRDFHPDVIRAFQGYSWPGDIRQLENVIGEISTHIFDNLVTLDSLQNLDLKYKGRPIEWNATPEAQQERDLLLHRVGWTEGWSKLTEPDFDRIHKWLKTLLTFDAMLLDELINQIQTRSSPKAIHFMKALLYLGLLDGQKAQHSEVQKVLALGWDFTNRVLSFIAGLDCEGIPGFHQPLVVRTWESGKWLYGLSKARGSVSSTNIGENHQNEEKRLAVK